MKYTEYPAISDIQAIVQKTIEKANNLKVAIQETPFRQPELTLCAS